MTGNRDRSVPLGRRGFLLGAGSLAASGVSGPAAGAPPRARSDDSAAAPWRRSTSANGWEVLTDDSPLLSRVTVEGTNAPLRLHVGGLEVLTYVVRRWHYEIGPVDLEPLQGHSSARTVRTPSESDFLSGSAVGVLPDFYPLGVRGGLWPWQVAVVEDIIGACRGVVRWCGREDPPMEGVFRIVVGSGDPRLTLASSAVDRGARAAGRA